MRLLKLDKIFRLTILLVGLLLIGGLSASPAQAGVAPPLDIDTCAPGLQPWQYTTKIVTCVGSKLVAASRQMASALANYMLPTVGAMFIFAIAWYGVRVLGGERQLAQKGISLIIRFGIVLLYLANAPSFIDVWLAVIVQFLDLLGLGYSPWDRLDTLIGKLIGIGPSLVLTQGLIGIIGASLLSSSTGIFMFMSGFMGLLDLLLFIFNVVFTYLLAITLICFMFAIAPLLVPMLIFFYTERYFNKWWHIMVSATLVPILLFSFLFFFLRIFSHLIVDIFDILGFPCSNPVDFTSCDSPDFRAYQKSNQPKYSWIMPADPHFSQQQQTVTAASDLSIPAVQSNVNPLLRRGFDKNMLNSPAIDFGPNHVKIMEQLMFAFISLWIFSSLMKALIRKIPNIADDIAGALNRISMQPTKIEMSIRQATRMNPDQMREKSAAVSENLKETMKRASYMATGGRNKSK